MAIAVGYNVCKAELSVHEEFVHVLEEDIKMLTSAVASLKVEKKEAEMEKLSCNFLELWRYIKKEDTS